MTHHDAPPPIRLLLVRHAPVIGEAGVIHGPDAPSDVSDGRLLQATARILHDLAPQHSPWCSPSRRTRETAAAMGLSPAFDARLAEQNFGDWTGRRHVDIESELGADAYMAFWSRPADNRPPNGESFVDQMARIRAFLDHLPAGDHAVVTHSGAIRAALGVALDMAPASALAFVIAPVSTTWLERTSGGWRIGWINRLA